MIQTFPLRTSYPLAIQERLSCLMKMAFPTIYQPGQGVYDLNQVLDFKMSRDLGGETHWWLAPSGGADTITAANCKAAYDVKNAVSQALSYDNNAAPLNGLADGTYDRTLGVAPAWANGVGLTYNGSTQWLNTNYLPSCGANCSLAIRYNAFGGGATNKVLTGIYSPGSLTVQNTSSLKGTYYNGTEFVNFQDTVPVPAAGTIIIAGKSVYIDNVLKGTIPAGSAVCTASIIVGALRVGAATIVQFADYVEIAYALYDIGLTLINVADLTTAMAAL